MQALQAKESVIKTDAVKAFSEYPLDKGQNFFDEYPVTVDSAVFLEENKAVWTTALSDMKAIEKESFFTTYGQIVAEICPEGNGAELFHVVVSLRQES